MPISRDSVFVVSGGSGAVTSACVAALAERYGCGFLLLGRTPCTPEPEWSAGCQDEAELKRRIAERAAAEGQKASPKEIERAYRARLSSRRIGALLKHIAAAGGKGEYLAVDITDRAALEAELAQALPSFGRVTGLIHAAGTLADKPIERKSERDFDEVYGAKVTGLENLLACLPVGDLDTAVLFSSAAGFFGNPGQSDYAMANEILNRVAERLRQAHPNLRVLSVNWGPWEAGMVSAELKHIFEARGIQVIPLEAGAETLLRLLDDGSIPTPVLVGSQLGSGRLQPGPVPRQYRVNRRLRVEDNPFLAAHQINGRPVLPMVCAVSWLANTGEQLFPGYTFRQVDDFSVLKGIVFDGDLAAGYTSRIDVVRHDDQVLAFDGLISSQADAGPERYHYRGRITLGASPAPAAAYTTFDLSEGPGAGDGPDLYRDGTLFHGPLFQGIERVLNATAERVTLRCRLPAIDGRAQGQFPVQTVNAFAADVQFQSLVIWARRFRAAGSLPLRAVRAQHYASVPFDETFYVSMEVREASDHQLLADVIAHDEQGRVYLSVTGASVTLSQSLTWAPPAETVS